MKRWGLLVTLATMAFLGAWLATRTHAKPPGPSVPAGGPQRITYHSTTSGLPAAARGSFPLPPLGAGGERRRPSDNPHGMPGHWRDMLVNYEPIDVETIDGAAARMHLDPALTAKLQRWARVSYEAMLAAWEGVIAGGDPSGVELRVQKIATARKVAFVRALGVPAWERFERLRDAIRDGEDVDDNGRPPGWHPPRYPTYDEIIPDPDASEYAHLFTD